MYRAIKKLGFGFFRSNLTGSRASYFFGIRVVAIFETLLFLSTITIFSYLFGDGTRFYNVEPHPFWLVLLVITVQYGTNEALFCAIVASALLLIGNLPQHDIDKTIYEYAFSVAYKPFLWCAVAVIIGGLRTRQINERHELFKKLRDSEKSTEVITEAYNRLKKLKEGLETRLAGEMRSSMVAYEAAKKLESLRPSSVLMAVEDVVVGIMNPESFSIFAHGPNGFEAAMCHGWGNVSYTRRFGFDDEIYKILVTRNRIMCAVNESDQKLLNDQGILAGAITDPNTGEVYGMLKIEKIAFIDISLNTIETFKILCDWIAMAYGNAMKYQNTKGKMIYNPDNAIFSFNLYELQLKNLKQLAAKLHLDLFEIRIKISSKLKLENRQFIQAAKFLKAEIEAIPEFSLLFDSGFKNEYVILVMGLSINDFKNLLAKLQNKIDTSSFVLEMSLIFDFKSVRIVGGEAKGEAISIDDATKKIDEMKQIIKNSKNEGDK